MTPAPPPGNAIDVSADTEFFEVPAMPPSDLDSDPTIHGLSGAFEPPEVFFLPVESEIGFSITPPPVRLTFQMYQDQAHSTAVYPGKDTNFAVIYAALGLAGEAGSVTNQVKKIHRDDNDLLTPERKEQIIRQLGDTLWYCAELATALDVSLDSVAQANLEKLASRQERGTLHGDGDAR